MYSTLQDLISSLKPGFFGTIEVGIQNGKPSQVRITETFKLENNSNRTSRGTGHESAPTR